MKKKLKFSLLTFACVLCCVFGFAACGPSDGDNDGSDDNAIQSEFAMGSGTEDSPYVIDKDYQWLNVAKYPDAYFELAADINLGDYATVAPTGTSENPFTGTIDGKNHKIEGAKVYSTHFTGLFGLTSGATIKNLGFANSSVHMESKSEDDVMGSFVAVARKGTVIENCYSEKVTLNFTKYSTKYVMMGGFAGSIESVSSVTYCHCDVNIKAPNGSHFYIGGFARLVSGSTVDCCYNTGTITVWGPSGVKVCRIGTFIDSIINSNVTNMYAEMSIDAKGATGVWYVAGYVDEEWNKFMLNFSDYQKTPDGRYETRKVINNASEDYNIYFPASQYAYANDTLDKDLWKDNAYWKKGKVHPELVSYEEYLQLKNSENG